MEDKSNLAIGSILDLGGSKTSDFFNNIVDLDTINGSGYVASGESAREIIKISNKLYIWDGTVATITDTMVDFANTTVNIVSEDDISKKAFKYWLKNMNKNNLNMRRGANELNSQIYTELLVSGNFFYTTNWESVEIDDSGTKVNLPMIIASVDPLLVDMKYNALENTKVFYFRSDDFDDTDFIGDISTSKILQKKGTDIVFKDGAINHIKFRGKSYQHWGIPFIHRAFLPIKVKLSLYDLDLNVIDGLINAILIFKLGTDEHPASQDRMNKFATLLKNKKSASLVWSHDVSIEKAGVNGDVLDFENRYIEANQAISRALGFSYLFIDGSGESRNAWLLTQPVTKRLIALQNMGKELYMDLCEQIVEKNKGAITFSDISIKAPTFSHETLIKALIMNMYDRGLLSRETTLDIVGFDIDVERVGKKADAEEDDTFYVPSLPFSSQQDANTGAGAGNKSNPTAPQSDMSKDGQPISKSSTNESKQVIDLFVDEIRREADSPEQANIIIREALGVISRNRKLKSVSKNAKAVADLQNYCEELHKELMQ